MTSTAAPEKNDLYIVKVGKAGEHRLNLINNIYNPYTLEFYKRAGLTTGMTVLDAGCGTGILTIELAKIVGAAGKIIGIDCSAEQLIIAKQNAKNAGVSNIEFIQASIYDADKLNIKFDFVCCRFVLMHLTTPTDALKTIYQSLKPGGIIACEEPEMSRCFASVNNQAFDISMQMLLDCGKKLGVDFDLGTKLYDMVSNIGFEHVNLSQVQPIVKEEPERQAFVLLTQESTDKYIEISIATQEVIAEIISELTTLTADPQVHFGCAMEYQVSGQRSL